MARAKTLDRFFMSLGTDIWDSLPGVSIEKSIENSTNPHVHARLIAWQLGVPWQSVQGLVDHLIASQSQALRRMSDDDASMARFIWDEVAMGSFETCGSPIEELFLAALSITVDPMWSWGAEPLASCGFWSGLSEPVGVDQQVKICDRRVDFAFFTESKRVQVALELDGHDFHERTKQQATKDKSNDRKIQEAGWLVLRFTGSEIWKDPIGCVDEVARIVRSKL